MNTPKAPVIWTYPELGDDLSGNGDKARSTCLRELIGAAGLPKGSSAFWPLILQEGNEADAGTAIPEARKADSLYFQQGLRLLSPRALIMFGARSISLSGLELSIHSPFTQVIRQGILYMILPEFKALLTDREAFSRTSTYLRASLTPIPGIFK